MKKILANLDPRWVQAAQGKISENLGKLLAQLEPASINHILAWTPFFAGEISIAPFISEQVALRSVYLPRTLSDSSMTFVKLGPDWDSSLQPGNFGIPEPTGSEIYDPACAGSTLVLVPGLAFDKDGNRLGRGKACYDIFLGHQRLAAAIKVGVCWSLQLVDNLPTESHDVMMDWICHERALAKVSVEFDEDFEE